MSHFKILICLLFLVGAKNICSAEFEAIPEKVKKSYEYLYGQKWKANFAVHSSAYNLHAVEFDLNSAVGIILENYEPDTYIGTKIVLNLQGSYEEIIRYFRDNNLPRVVVKKTRSKIIMPKLENDVSEQASCSGSPSLGDLECDAEDSLEKERVQDTVRVDVSKLKTQDKVKVVEQEFISTLGDYDFAEVDTRGNFLWTDRLINCFCRKKWF